jgi:hypothetical protein
MIRTSTLHRTCRADPVELAVSQDAQQPGLGICGHIPDFIEKQGAAIGLFEAPLTLPSGTCKGAFFVAKELGFNQVFGDGGHIQGDKGFACSGAVVMQGACNQLFTCTGLTVDQHGDITV